MIQMTHPYRTHTCGELKLADKGKTVRLSGWIHRIRDHGQLLFVDLRDHYGMTQCVIENHGDVFKRLEKFSNESVICINGEVVARTPETVNSKMSTGEIEVAIQDVRLLSAADPLPLNVNSTQEFPEDTRLTYRFLDLRREQLHKNIVLRSNIIASLRRRMIEQGFVEFQTPILTSSSPEGARDFLVPSRMHPGHFYALPQAPQQFKQLLMVAGFDRYFQIAPCFRDEDARADRSPGEFYQLDLEMSFVTQEDVFAAVEPVLTGVFQEFAEDRTVDSFPYRRIPFAESLLKYGSDKPDLRNPIIIADVTDIFAESEFTAFKEAIAKGCVVRAVPGPKCSTKSRKFFDDLNDWAKELGLPGLGYITFQDGAAKGPIAKFLSEAQLNALKTQAGADEGDSVFFVCHKNAWKFAGQLRTKLGQDLDLIEKNAFRFCWIVDFPMFEMDEDTGKIDFSHNPFSMPQGELEALLTKDPLTINAYQYDIVCNGVELCSGAIRNHLPEIMYKAFEIAGYTQEDVEGKFGGLLNAFKYGAPPHGGCAPGVDRIVMLLADEPNIREIIAFPLNQQAQDLLMQAPTKLGNDRLKELHIEVKLPRKLQEKELQHVG